MESTPVPDINFDPMPIVESINDYVPFVSQIFASPIAIAISLAIVGFLFAAVVGAFYWYQNKDSL